MRELRRCAPARRGSIRSFLAVAESHRRRGVGSALVRRSSEQLAAAGFRYSVAFCTSPKSVAVFAQSGFERWGGQTVATFEHAGRRWFEHVPDEWAVMVRKH